MKREPTDYWGPIFQSISAHHRLGVLPGPNQPAPALHMGPAHGIHGFFRCLLFIRSALSDRHVTVASHQPLKNFIPKKKPLKNFPRKNHESNYCFSPTCVGLGFQLVDIILVPVPSTKINHHSSAESTRLTGPFTSRWRCRRDQITLSSRNFIQSSAGQQKKGVGMAWNASTSPA